MVNFYHFLMLNYMREKKIRNLARIIGKGINVKKNLESLKNKETKSLIEIIEFLCELEATVNNLNLLGINVFPIEEKYLNVIRILLKEIYGEVKCNVIMWWVFESISPEGDVLPLVDEKNEEHIIKTPRQLVKFLKRYD